MIGYVLDGDLDYAVKKVGSAVEKRHKRLKLTRKKELQPSSLLPGKKQAAETRHASRKSQLIIHHLFLS